MDRSAEMGSGVRVRESNETATPTTSFQFNEKEHGRQHNLTYEKLK